MSRLLASTAVALTVVLIALGWRRFDVPDADELPRATTGGGERQEATRPQRFAFAPADPLHGRSVQALKQAMRDGPLAGALPDGDWACAESGGLRPDVRIRLRMEWYGNQLGPFTADQIGRVLGDEAAAACGPAAGQEAAALWAAYQQALAGQERLGRVSDRRALAEALSSATSHRRAVMGAAWAEAFFGDEERLLAARLAQPQAALANALPSPLPDAAQRESALEAEWAAWQARIDAARSDAAQIEASGDLSEGERHAQLLALIDSRFVPEERVRASALVLRR